MKTLQVYNGDIQLDSGGKLQFVVGTNKLLQDLSLWLQEKYGVGFTSPNFGSTLNSMIGGSITPGQLSKISIEVRRVLENYRANQLVQLQQAQTSSQLSNWSKGEILQSIDDINVTPGSGYVIVEVSITTLANSQTSLNLVLTANGIQVQNG